MSDEHKRPTARDFSREVLTLFDEYVHGAFDRRGFLERAAAYAGSATAATGLLAVLSPDFAYAQKVAADDARIAVSRVDIPSPSGYGTIKAYIARPKGASPRAKKPVVVVVHENRGLNPHIEDIARRLATDGFIAVAPDALTPLGGYPGDEDKARALFPQLDQAKTRADFLAAAAWAQALPDGNGRLGAVGFCYGGGVVNFLATQLPVLRAAAPFYGAPPPLDAVPAIKAEMLIQHAGNDTRLVATWPDYEKALKAANVKYQGYVYPGVEHGFNNDTTPRYDEKAAGLAWQRTIALFKRTLK
jgi:carboxymethylenebutenolidase